MEESLLEWAVTNTAQRNQEILLNQRNIHPRDLAIQFDEPSHTYHIAGEKAQISVTGFKELFSHPFNQDSAVMMVFQKTLALPHAKRLKDEGKQHLVRVDNPQSKYHGQTRREVLQWNHAAPLGTKMHDRIDRFLSLREEDLRDYTASHLHLFDKFCQPDDTVEEKVIFHQFIGVLRDFYKNGWRPFRTEWRVWFKEGDQLVAGSIDCVMVRTVPGGAKEYAVLDWKRTDKPLNSVFPKAPPFLPFPLDKYPNCTLNQYGFQVELYRWILSNYYGIHVPETYIIQLKPAKTDRALPNIFKIPDMQVDIQRCVDVYLQTQRLKTAFNKWDRHEILKGMDIVVPNLSHPLFFESCDEYRNKEEEESSAEEEEEGESMDSEEEQQEGVDTI